MNEKPITRRDWFRLKQRPDILSDSAAEAPARLPRVLDQNFDSIPLPPNHDGLDLSALPPICEAMLDAVKVSELANDISELGQEVTLMQRSAAEGQAVASKATTQSKLSLAFDSLLTGRIQRLQIRYHWNGANWIDTLERRNEQFRLVRVCHQAPKTV
jgi:hypothetical protein